MSFLVITAIVAFLGPNIFSFVSIILMPELFGHPLH